MAMNISGLGNTYNGINTNSKQYKALKEKGWLSGIMQNEAMMSAYHYHDMQDMEFTVQEGKL